MIFIKNHLAPEKYKPFYKKCDLTFHDADDISSNEFLPEIIVDGCINPAYAEEFRVESVDTPGDALTWFKPKIFEVREISFAEVKWFIKGIQFLPDRRP